MTRWEHTVVHIKKKKRRENILHILNITTKERHFEKYEVL